MFPVGERSLRVAAVGAADGIGERLDGLEPVPNRRLAVTVTEPASFEEEGLGGATVDGVVVDGASFDDGGVAALERLEEAAPALASIWLCDGDYDRRAAEAVAAGASATLPRSLLDDDPDLAGRRIAAVVGRELAADALGDVYDGVAGTITLHDPSTGRMLHANRTLGELVGYDREELLERTIGDLTADLPGYDHERALQILRSVPDGDGPIEVEWPLETADGTVRWVEVQLRALTVGRRELVLATSREVTERRRREREYEAIFDGVNDVISVHDPWAETLLDVNESLCELTGYGREALLDMGVDGFSATDDGYTAERAYEVQQRVASAGESETVDWLVETATGERRRLQVVLSPARIAGEDRVLVLGRDVTERRQLERSYQEVFDNVSDGLVVHDPETGEIVDVNQQFCEMNGYDREALVGETIDVVTAPDHDLEAAQERIARARRGDPQLFEWRNRRRDGETFPVEVHLSVVDVLGEERVLASVRDISGRKRREREFEQIFNGVSDIVNVYDPDTGELVAVNDTMCELTGYDRDELLEHGLDAVSAADEGYTADRAAEVIDAVMDSDEPREFEWCLETADGDRRWLEVKATPADVGGERRLLTISRDVTEQRRTERRMRAILDRIDEAIFLSAAHEITEASQDPDYVSAGYDDIWGQPLEDIHERYPEGFFGTLHPDDEAAYRAFVEGIVDDIDAGEAGERYTREYRIVTPVEADDRPLAGRGEPPAEAVRWVRSDYYPVEWATDESPRVIIVSRDVTRRKDRERRIASFEAATDDLTTADTPGEAARTAVAAAEDELRLSAVGVFLYDDEAGVLEPAVQSDSLPDGIGARPVRPDGGPLWEAFATGTLRGGTVDASGADDAGWRESLADWRAVPLGNHGVLLVGATDAALDSDTVQSAHVLGATLEAALNYLYGQQRLASHEEKLRTETERARRLDRIARLTQEVEAAITQASGPREIERTVCERLVETGPYAVAWIGGVEVGADRITARTVVGAADRYGQALDLATTDDGSDRHPAVAAWQTDAVQVANSIVGDGPASDWRRYLLQHGYQSACAVPLTYDGITHGVLVLTAASPNAFGDREAEVLDQLGTSIGHALTGIERRRALESDATVELEFRGDDDGLAFARLAREAGCRVRHERTVHREDDSVSVYYSIEGDLPAEVEARAAAVLPGDVETVREAADAVLVEAVSAAWFGAPLAESGAVLRRAEATPEETTLTVELPGRSDVRAFTDRVERLAPGLELAAKRHHQRADRTPDELLNRVERELTARQLEALRTAYEAGYFEWPREHDGSEVADRLGITQPTFNKHLRIAEKKTFGTILQVDA